MNKTEINAGNYNYGFISNNGEKIMDGVQIHKNSV